MSVLPKALEDLIEALGSLPGVGPRTAERYAYYLLRANATKASRLSSTIDNLQNGIGYCQVTFALIESGQTISPLYSDPKRDKTVIAIVADLFDIVALEKTNLYHGTYHVLGGLISPIDGIGPENLHLPQLANALKLTK